MTESAAGRMVDVLRQAIQDAGVSQLELSRRSGVSVASINRFSHARRDLTFAAAAKLCATLGLALIPIARPRKPRV